MESLTVSLSQCEDTLKQQAKKTADLEAQRSAVDEKLVQHVSDGNRVNGGGEGCCCVRCWQKTCCGGGGVGVDIVPYIHLHTHHALVCSGCGVSVCVLRPCFVQLNIYFFLKNSFTHSLLVMRACPPAPRQREDVNQYAMGCETMKKSLELEKQRYRGLLEQRVVDTGEAKLAADSARAANAILQKAIKEYDVRAHVMYGHPIIPCFSPMQSVCW